MKNNIYVRSNKSIKNISFIRMILLLPIILYGIYKHGVYLYLNKYVDVLHMFKPLVFILIGAFIGIFVNIVYEYIFKRSKEKLIDVIFSSFHMEYGILLGCIVSINTNILLYTGVTFGLFFISKFIKNRINIMALVFLIIYLVSIYVLDGYSYLNMYDTSKVFSLDFMDYMIGKGAGGIAATNIVLIIISIIGMGVSSNTKTNITISSISVLAVLFGVYAIITGNSYGSLLLSNSYIFICTYVATDYVTSSYTMNGILIYGILFGVLTFGLYFVNPILAPYIAILITSLFNNVIDRIGNKFIKEN